MFRLQPYPSLHFTLVLMSSGARGAWHPPRKVLQVYLIKLIQNQWVEVYYGPLAGHEIYLEAKLA